MRSALEQVLRPAAYEKMLALGQRFEDGVLGAIRKCSGRL